MRARRKLRRKRSTLHPSRRPLQQGDLDGLCGVYAIINAVRLVCSELDSESCDALFRILVTTLERRGPTARCAIWSGLGLQMLRLLIHRAITFVWKEFKVRLIVYRIPAEVRRARSMNVLWNHLEPLIGTRSIALFAISGRYNHWTVAYAISARQLTLFDSDGILLLRRSACTLRSTRNRHRITPGSITLIERV
jgi:hypothetical protein